MQIKDRAKDIIISGGENISTVNKDMRHHHTRHHDVLKRQERFILMQGNATYFLIIHLIARLSNFLCVYTTSCVGRS